jgi:hypothetical protein
LPLSGHIYGGKQLFGNKTTPGCNNGYCALAKWDLKENGGNGDGIIDFHDAVWPRLRLWIDANHDGIAQPDELHSLPELGVLSISLKYSDDQYQDAFGNWFHYKAALNPNPLDGTSKDGRLTYDVFFLVDKQKAAKCPARKKPFPKSNSLQNLGTIVER